MALKKYNVSGNKLPYIEKVMQNRHYDYKICGDKIETELSGNQFHKVVIRATMLMMAEEDGFPRLHVSELNDIEALNEAGDVYVLIGKDMKPFWD